MKQEDLLERIAVLESMNDQLAAELQYIDELAKKIGFEQGLKTLKAAAKDLWEEQNHNDEENPFD